MALPVLKAGAGTPITSSMAERLLHAYPLHRRLLRTLNFPGVVWEFRSRGDSWSRARYHAHLWVWGFMPSPSEGTLTRRADQRGG